MHVLMNGTISSIHTIKSHEMPSQETGECLSAKGESPYTCPWFWKVVPNKLIYSGCSGRGTWTFGHIVYFWANLNNAYIQTAATTALKKTSIRHIKFRSKMLMLYRMLCHLLTSKVLLKVSLSFYIINKSWISRIAITLSCPRPTLKWNFRS